MTETDVSTMKALTLHQPWASLVALGAKTVETRSWSTKYRGPIAIHAGARRVHHGQFFLLARTAQQSGLIDAEAEQDFRSFDVPFGSVVATCTLADVVEVGTADCVMGADGPGWRTEVLRSGADHVEVVFVGKEQMPYGDFTPGRYAWLLEDIKEVDPPELAKGRQGLWTWNRGGSKSHD